VFFFGGGERTAGKRMVYGAFVGSAGGRSAVAVPRSGTAATCARRSAVACAATEVAGPRGVNETKWTETIDKLTESLSLDEAAAEKAALRAFGWGTQVFWQKTKVNEIPEPEDVEKHLKYLSDLFEGDSDSIAKVVTKFPEVLALDIEGNLDVNVNKLKTEYRMDEKRIRNCVLDMPNLLGFRVDCMGDCIGDCSRCWARF